MRFLLQFHPRNFFRALRKIDDEAAAERANLTGPDYRPAVTLFVATFCLLIVHYLKLSSSFYMFLEDLSQFTGHAPQQLGLELSRTTFSRLLIFGWWGFWHLVGYVLIPLAAIKWLLRDSVQKYGLGIAGLRQYLKWCVFLATPMLVATLLVSSRKDFASMYPFYRLAFRSWVDLLAWESIYLTQVIFHEFFFRGFLLYGCKRAFGSTAIFVMCVPYFMIHLGKPWIEATGSIFFGLFLGMLVLRARSIWSAVLVHSAVALSMDLLALVQTRGLPTRWWP